MKDLTTGSVPKLIFSFALPMLIGNVFQQLYNVVDSIIVGNFIGKQALAAVGASFPIIFILIALVIGVSMGFTIIISQYFGAKDYDKIKRVVDTMNYFLLVSSIVVTLLGYFFCDEIFALMRLPADVLPEATQYLKMYFLGMIAFFGFNGITAVLRGLGDSKTPLYFLIISTLLNIALDLFFVIVLKSGVSGVALATIISQAVSFILAIIYINRTHKLLNFSFSNMVFDKKIFSLSLKIGLPSGLQQTFVSLGMIALYGIVNRFGTDVVAAYSVAGRIDSFATIPAMNFAAALTTFVGQNLGANKIDRVKKGYYSTLWMTSLISIAGSILIISFCKTIMGWFTDDAEVIKIGKEYLIIVSSFYVFFSVMFTSNGVMRGAGDTLIPMFITLITLWLIRIPLAWYLSGHFGETGIWWSMPIAWFFGMTFSYFYYIYGNWKKKIIVKHSNIDQ